MLWLADPDHTLHGAPLGSPRISRRCEVRMIVSVSCRDGRGASARRDEILLAVGSDHGQETIAGSVDVDAWLAQKGFAREVATGSIAVAGQGTAALLYATSEARPAFLAVLDQIRIEPWVDDVIAGEDLGRRASRRAAESLPR